MTQDMTQKQTTKTEETAEADGAPEQPEIIILKKDDRGEFRFVEMKRNMVNGKVIIRRRRSYFRADDKKET